MTFTKTTSGYPRSSGKLRRNAAVQQQTKAAEFEASRVISRILIGVRANAPAYSVRSLEMSNALALPASAWFGFSEDWLVLDTVALPLIVSLQRSSS